MAEDLVLDTAIRNWVLMPLSLVMALIGILRYFVSKLMRTFQNPDGKIVKEGQVMIRARNLRSSANFIPPKSFRARRFYYSNEENNDRLSNLPEDIIVNILSLVDTKDATRNNILSRRWRYMSTYLTSMHFHHAISVDLVLDYEPEWFDIEKQKYMNWVNQAVSKHRVPIINDFRICLPFDSRYTTDINKWIAFAISKRVKNLELDFAYARFESTSSRRLYFYSLPSNFFDGQNNYLTSICLKCVNINETVLQLLLCQCHALEKLYIEGAKYLSRVTTITASSKKLKYLAILDCKRLSQVYIHAASLESFEFSTLGERSNNVVYASVPSLVEARFRWLYRCNHSLPAFLQTKCFPAQLTKLSLHMTMITVRDVVVPSFPNVKYLELRVVVKSHRNLVPLMSIAEACPILEDFKLQLFWRWYSCGCEELKTDSTNDSTESDSNSTESDSDSTDSEWETESSNSELDNESADEESDNESAYEESDGESAYEESDSESVDAMSDSELADSKSENDSTDSELKSESANCSLDYVKHWLETKEVTNATLPYLRKLEWLGAFSVHDNLEVQLALYCVKNAINLEKFICDPRDLPSRFANPGDIDEIVEGGRRRARRLATVIPSHIQYVIL